MLKLIPCALLLAALSAHADPPRITPITEPAGDEAIPLKGSPGKLRVMARCVSSIALSPDGRKLAVGLKDGGGGATGEESAKFVAVLLWDLTAAKVVSTIPVDGVPSDVFWLADGTLWVTEAMNATIRRLDVEKGVVAESRKLRVDPTKLSMNFDSRVRISPDGKFAVVAGFDPAPALYELPGWKLVGPLEGAGGISPVEGTWSRDSKSWITASRRPEMVTRWDISKREAQRLGAGFAPVEGPDGRVWALTEDHLAFGPVEPKQDEKRDWFRNSDSKLTLARYSPDGVFLALGREDGKVVIVDVASASKFTSFLHAGVPDKSGAVICLLWAPDSSWVAAGRIDGSSDLLRPEVPAGK